MQMEEKTKAVNCQKYLLTFKSIWKEWVSLYVAFSHMYVSMFYSKWSLIPLTSPCSLLHFSCFLLSFHKILPSAFITVYSNYPHSFLVPQCYSSLQYHFLVYTTSDNKNTCAEMHAHTYSHTQAHIYLPN